MQPNLCIGLLPGMTFCVAFAIPGRTRILAQVFLVESVIEVDVMFDPRPGLVHYLPAAHRNLEGKIVVRPVRDELLGPKVHPLKQGPVRSPHRRVAGESPEPLPVVDGQPHQGFVVHLLQALDQNVERIGEVLGVVAGPGQELLGGEPKPSVVGPRDPVGTPLADPSDSGARQELQGSVR